MTKLQSEREVSSKCISSSKQCPLDSNNRRQCPSLVSDDDDNDEIKEGALLFPLALIGPHYSAIALELNKLTPYYNITSISYCNGGRRLSDERIYRSFVRVNPSSIGESRGALQMLQMWNVTRFYCFYEANGKHEDVMLEFEKQAEQIGIFSLGCDPIYPENLAAIDVVVENIQNRDARYIVLSNLRELNGAFFCRAWQLNLDLRQRVFIIVEDNHRNIPFWHPWQNVMIQQLGCSDDTMREALHGVFRFHSDFALPTQTQIEQLITKENVPMPIPLNMTRKCTRGRVESKTRSKTTSRKCAMAKA